MRRPLLVLIPVLASTWFACQCGGTASPCDGVRCSTGLVCDPNSGKCVVEGATGGGSGGGSGGAAQGGGTGGSAATCSPACTSSAPVCDPATTTCKVCTESLGCSGATPICIPFANGNLGRCVTCSATTGCSGLTPFCDLTLGDTGQCVGCRTHDDCTAPGLNTCDFTSHSCVAGSASGGGAGGGTGGGSGTGGGGPWTGTAYFGDGGVTAHCLGGAPPATQCTTECSRGYECISGKCVLRGSHGPLQVTLRFPYAEDLDLHVVEPLPDAGTCEIYYQEPNLPPDGGLPPIPLPFPIPLPKGCGAQGWLDVDSNAACRIDNIDVENVIYAATAHPTPGKYIVRVDYWQYCSQAPVPYEVEVRLGGQSRYYCGTFNSNEADSGGKGSGRFIADFIVQ